MRRVAIAISLMLSPGCDRSAAQTKESAEDSPGKAVLEKLDAAKVKTARNEVKRLKHAAEQYMMVHDDKCPETLGDLLSERFVPQLDDDPWDHAYVLECAQGSVTVSSAGPDGQPGTDDDVGSE